MLQEQAEDYGNVPWHVHEVLAPLHSAVSVLRHMQPDVTWVPSASSGLVINLSWPNPAFTKPLTKVLAKFWRAESTALPAGARPSTR